MGQQLGEGLRNLVQDECVGLDEGLDLLHQQLGFELVRSGILIEIHSPAVKPIHAHQETHQLGVARRLGKMP
ncbi:hypothetical protein D3C79_1045020 [compost metagenome]